MRLIINLFINLHNEDGWSYIEEKIGIAAKKECRLLNNYVITLYMKLVPDKHKYFFRITYKHCIWELILSAQLGIGKIISYFRKVIKYNVLLKGFMWNAEKYLAAFSELKFK